MTEAKATYLINKVHLKSRRIRYLFRWIFTVCIPSTISVPRLRLHQLKPGIETGYREAHARQMALWRITQVGKGCWNAAQNTSLSLFVRWLTMTSSKYVLYLLFFTIYALLLSAIYWFIACSINQSCRAIISRIMKISNILNSGRSVSTCWYIHTLRVWYESQFANYILGSRLWF